MGRIIEPKGLIVHAMSEFIHRSALEYYDKSESEIQSYPELIEGKAWLEALGFSAHGFIAVNGDWISGNVSAPERGLHAGKSEHNGLNWLNNHYLGFEIYVAGENDYGSFLKKMETPGTYAQCQVDQAVAMASLWADEYGFGVDSIVTHQMVSGDHVRGEGKGKRDPGSAFPWEEFISAVESNLK